MVYHDGRLIQEASGVYGASGTNNIAEYAAVIEALHFLADQGLTGEPVEIRSDSSLLVNQLTGYWRVRSPHLLQMYRQVRDLERLFEAGVKYRWIPRELNEHADMLSRLAYEEA